MSNGYLITFALFAIFFLALPFASAITTNDLVSYWNFDETSGNLLDQHSSNDGTNTNITYEQTGIINDAYLYNGTTSTTNLGSPASLEPALTGFSWGAWINVDASFSADGGIMGKQSVTSWNKIKYRLAYVNTGTKFGCGVGNTTATAGDTYSGSISKGTWYQVVCTFDGSKVRLYLDGDYVSAYSWSGTLPTNNTDFTFGYVTDGSQQFKGNVDEAFFFDKNLSDTDITELYNSGSGLAYPFVATQQARITWNVYRTGTSSHLTSVSADCNVNAMDFTTQNSPVTGAYVDQNTNYSCVFSRTGYTNSSAQTGVVDSNKTVTVYLSDATNPSVGQTVANGFTINDTQIWGTGTISATASDTGSGLASCEYTIDNGANWVAGDLNATHCYKSGITVVVGTTPQYNLRATDVATNVGTGTATVEYTADDVNPSVGQTVANGFSINGSYISGSGIISATATDATSGIETCEYTVNNGSSWASADKNTTHCYKSYSIPSDGSYIFNLRATDYASNTGTGTATITYYADATPPVTTFSSYQVTGTTDQNITLSCTDNNSGCKAINYNINNEGWNNVRVDSNILTTYFNGSEYNALSFSNDWQLLYTISDLVDGNDIYSIATTLKLKEGGGAGGTQTANAKLRYNYTNSTYTESDTVSNASTDYATKTFTTFSNPEKKLSTIGVYGSITQAVAEYVYVDDLNMQYISYKSYNEVDYSFLYSGSGDHNIQYFSTDNADNNETTNTDTFTTTGLLRLNYYADNNTPLDEVYLEFNGTPYYSDTNTYQIIDLNGITSGNKTILLQVTGYQEKSFTIPNITSFSDLNINIGFIPSTQLSTVAFQVFTETGAIKPNTTFYVYDNTNNYLIDIQTTDTQGKFTLNLNNTKSDYNFISTDLNFGTTLWTINKPKDASTLTDIVGNWKYSITGNSYASATNIVAGITKILLQNTVNPYYIKIQDVNESYTASNFGLLSVTSEKTKTLNPYLYSFGDAELKLIKLLDYSTNQPIAEAKELILSLYTDTNGIIEIGTYLNDSTGTYNIYMDSNAQYRLLIDEQVFELRPTLNIYYIYLVSESGLDIDGNVLPIDNNFVDLTSPTIILQIRQYFFGCSLEEQNCYPSMVFSLICIVILAIGFVGLLRVNPLEQSIITAVLLGMFAFIGFIPIWLFAISIIIVLAWGVFS